MAREQLGGICVGSHCRVSKRRIGLRQFRLGVIEPSAVHTRCNSHRPVRLVVSYFRRAVAFVARMNRSATDGLFDCGSIQLRPRSFGIVRGPAFAGASTHRTVDA